MGQTKIIKLNCGNRGRSVSVECKKGFGKLRGLMFVKKKKAKPIIFEFNTITKMAIHSFFVKFSFIAVWLDNRNNVLESKIVKPFKFNVSPSVKYFKLLEIPLTPKYAKLMKYLVGGKSKYLSC